MATPLLNISPLDGRYAKQIDSLRNHLSEFGLIKTRVEVEILWLISLGIIQKLKR
jgi:adenylosuccinate lyase